MRQAGCDLKADVGIRGGQAREQRRQSAQGLRRRLVRRCGLAGGRGGMHRGDADRLGCEMEQAAQQRPAALIDQAELGGIVAVARVQYTRSLQ